MNRFRLSIIVSMFLFVVSVLNLTASEKGISLANVNPEIKMKGDNSVLVVLVDKSTGKELTAEQTKKFEVTYSIGELSDNELASKKPKMLELNQPIKLSEFNFPERMDDNKSISGKQLLKMGESLFDKKLYIDVKEIDTGKAKKIAVNICRALAKIQLENYGRVTEQAVLNDPEEMKRWDIVGKITPADYGYKTYYELEGNDAIPTTDNLKLDAWYIPDRHNDAGKKCILLVHGRTSNKLKPMRYLNIVNLLENSDQYSILLPDLRNSGESPRSITYFGYKFGEDVLSCIKYLNEVKGKNEFIIMGSSQGGMATQVAYFRLKNDKKYSELKNKITIDKLILDCPLSNVLNTVVYSANNMFKNPWLTTALDIVYVIPALYGYNLDLKDIGTDLSQQRMQFLFKNLDIPTLVLESKEDTTTPYAASLKGELDALKGNKNLKSIIFEKGEHVKVYEANLTEYTDAVVNFIEPEEMAQ